MYRPAATVYTTVYYVNVDCSHYSAFTQRASVEPCSPQITIAKITCNKYQLFSYTYNFLQALLLLGPPCLRCPFQLEGMEGSRYASGMEQSADGSRSDSRTCHVAVLSSRRRRFYLYNGITVQCERTCLNVP